MLHHPDYYNKEDHPDEVDIVATKYRADVIVTITALFWGDMTRFVNYTGRPGPGGGE